MDRPFTIRTGTAMARKLDLRTGKPVWLAYRAPAVPVAALTRDVTADVLVVGMGISGAMICDAVSAAGHSVIGVDRRRPLAGSTPASTALVQFEVDQPVTLLAQKLGKAKAERAWRRSRLAVLNLKGRIGDLGIRCRAASRPSLYLSGNVLGPGGLQAEARARTEIGIYSRYLKPAEVEAAFGIAGRSAILSQDNLAIDPRQLTAGLLLASRARGARFYKGVEIVGFEETASGVAAASAKGPVIRAGHVVLATGYELTDIVPRAPHQIISSWSIATRPQPANLWQDQAFIWEASDPYLYIRTTSDGRVICGGEDEDFTDEEKRDALIEEKSQTLTRKLGELLPKLDCRPEFKWAGAFGSTSTGLPFIGPVPRHPRIHAVMGYGGNGITYSRIAAELIATALDGGKDLDADIYAFPG
jgi:glycine/D-amino acid oxidase-like deaminating enzyme